MAPVLALVASAAVAPDAHAQGRRRPPVAKPAPKPAPAPAPAPAAPAGEPDRAPATTGVSPDRAPASSVAEMTAAVPGGITAEQVATRAMQTSYTARAQEETLAAASARAEQAWTNYLPRVGLVGRYTRLSNFTQPSLGGSGGGGGTGGALVGTTAAPGTPNPPTVAVDPNSLFGSFKFPVVLNNYLAQATIAVPISDYFLRIGKAYTAATHAEEAARYDVAAARAKSYADGKIAYYTWLRARGAAAVAQQSLAVAQAHQKDAENLFAVGNASKADVLRAQTAVAAAELGVERGKNGIIIAERQIRIAVHAREEESLQPGDSLDGALPAVQGGLKQFVAEAEAQRPEVKSIDKNADAARKQAAVARAGNYPVLSGFGDVTYANPNPRRIPQTQDWFATWSLGAQITWSPNDVLLAGPTSQDAEARANALDAQKLAVRDGVELEVTQAYQGVLESDVAITTTQRQLDSATEGYRVARELFNAGRGTSTTLIDAETALAQARFDNLNAKVDARVARIRLDHALGRDAHSAP